MQTCVRAGKASFFEAYVLTQDQYYHRHLVPQPEDFFVHCATLALSRDSFQRLAGLRVRDADANGRCAKIPLP